MKRLIPVVVAVILAAGCCSLSLHRGTPEGMHLVDPSQKASVQEKKQVVSGDLMPPVIARPVHRVP